MPIKNKIALIYSTVFILIIFVVSCFIIINSIHYYKGSSVEEMDESLDKVEEYIINGGKVTPKLISAQINNPYIVVRACEIQNGMVKPPDVPDEFLPDNNFPQKPEDVPPKVEHNKYFADRSVKMGNIKGDS